MLALPDAVTIHNATLTTDSRRVAKHFGKRHDSVLRAFDRLTCSREFSRHNFEAADELDEQGKPRRIVRMSKDGFMFLVMGFTGKEAARIKEAFIGAFNEMAAQLQRLEFDVFRSYWAQRLDLEKRDQASFDWASFGSRKMHQRRRELPEIRRERARLEAAMQPPLPGVQVPVGLPVAPSLTTIRKGRASNDPKKKRAA